MSGFEGVDPDEMEEEEDEATELGGMQTLNEDSPSGSGEGSSEEEEDSEEEDSEDDDDEDDEDEVDHEEYRQNSYSRKYHMLLERCEAIQQDNERLVSRICEVRQLLKQGVRERKYLMNRLDAYGDNYRNVPIVMPPEENEAQSHTKKQKVKKQRIKKAMANPSGAQSMDESLNISANTSSSTKPKKTKSEPRDPNLPKRPQNAFFQYCQEMRPVVQKEFLKNHKVNLTKKELTKILATRWNDLEESQKQFYTNLYEQEKLRYAESMIRYKQKKKV